MAVIVRLPRSLFKCSLNCSPQNSHGGGVGCGLSTYFDAMLVIPLFSWLMMSVGPISRSDPPSPKKPTVLI